MLAFPNVYYVFTIVREMDFSCSVNFRTPKIAINITARFQQINFTTDKCYINTNRIANSEYPEQTVQLPFHIQASFIPSRPIPGNTLIFALRGIGKLNLICNIFLFIRAINPVRTALLCTISCRYNDINFKNLTL